MINAGWRSISMINYIDDQEIITTREAMHNYSEYYIGFVIVKQNLRSPDFEEGYVIFTTDTYNEGLEESIDSDLNISILRGYEVDEPVEVGGLEVVWR